MRDKSASTRHGIRPPGHDPFVRLSIDATLQLVSRLRQKLLWTHLIFNGRIFVIFKLMVVWRVGWLASPACRLGQVLNIILRQVIR
jgi:hypothetical protein